MPPPEILDDEVWIALENRAGYKKFGAVLVAAAGVEFARMGDRGVLSRPGSWGPRSRTENAPDSRLLELPPAADGGRIGFRVAMAALAGADSSDWEVKGARTAAWVVQRIAEQGPVLVRPHRAGAALGGVPPRRDRQPFLAEQGAAGISGWGRRRGGVLHRQRGRVGDVPRAGGDGTRSFVLRVGTQWAPSEKRFWRLALALRWLFGPRRRCSGLEMQLILGHVVSLATLRRDFFAILHACYTFAQQVKGEQRVPVWPSVKEELRAFLALMPLLCAPLDLERRPRVQAIDASLRRFGVLESTWGTEACAAVGRWKERARFRGVNVSAEDPRERALGRADAGFPELPAQDLFQATWRVTASRRWKWWS